MPLTDHLLADERLLFGILVLLADLLGGSEAHPRHLVPRDGRGQGPFDWRVVSLGGVPTVVVGIIFDRKDIRETVRSPRIWNLACASFRST